jgi:hypothetical protein
MADTSYEFYPNGAIAVDGGELQDAHDISFEITNGVKGIYTFRNSGKASGFTGGHKSGKCSFKTFVARSGMERDYPKDVDKKTVKRVKFKLPGKTVVMEGVYKTVSGTASSENAWELTIAMEDCSYSTGG